MASMISGRALRQSKYGITVTRTRTNLPATTTSNLFTITGGRILLTGIVGEVQNVPIQALANTLSLNTISTVGGITTNLTAGVDVTGAAIGALYGITGVRTEAALLGSNIPTNNELVIQAGSIRWTTTATSTGQMAWSLLYIPLDDGASVVAV